MIPGTRLATAETYLLQASTIAAHFPCALLKAIRKVCQTTRVALLYMLWECFIIAAKMAVGMEALVLKQAATLHNFNFKHTRVGSPAGSRGSVEALHPSSFMGDLSLGCLC